MSRTEIPKKRPDLLYAVLDANILMHFQYVIHLDWPAVLGAKKVCLVCTPILFRELDDLKDKDSRPGRGDLARRVSKTLQTPLEDAPANVAVALPQRPNTYVMSWEEDSFNINGELRIEKRDDHYVAAALHFQTSKPDASLLLVARDFNLRQRAKRFGIPARTLPDDLRRPLPLTEEERRLKKFEEVEPKVRIDVEPVQQDVMLLPYGERAQTIHQLCDYYKNEFESLTKGLTEKYSYFLQKHGRHGHSTPLEHPSDFRDYKVQDVLYASREFNFNVTVEMLSPQKTATATVDSRAYGYKPYDDYQQQLDEWRKLIETFYRVASECVAKLDVARRDHQYYLFTVSCTHTGGNGIQDGKLAVTINSPYSFNLRLPSTEAERRSHLHLGEPPPTVWQDVLESPNSRKPSFNEKIYPFNNLHPGKSIECSSLYIHVAQHYGASNSPEVTLAVELTGLNVREPIRREITVALLHTEKQ